MFLRMTVTDASIDDVGRSLGRGRARSAVLGGPAARRVLLRPSGLGLRRDTRVATGARSRRRAQRRGGVVDGEREPEVLAQLVAVGLVEVDEATWEHLIEPAPDASRLGLTGEIRRGRGRRLRRRVWRIEWPRSWTPRGSPLPPSSSRPTGVTRTRTRSMRSMIPITSTSEARAAWSATHRATCRRAYGFTRSLELGRGRVTLPPRLHRCRHAGRCGEGGRAADDPDRPTSGTTCCSPRPCAPIWCRCRRSGRPWVLPRCPRRQHGPLGAPDPDLAPAHHRRLTGPSERANNAELAWRIRRSAGTSTQVLAGREGQAGRRPRRPAQARSETAWASLAGGSSRSAAIQWRHVVSAMPTMP